MTKSLAFILTGLLHLSIFGVAGVLSSHFATQGKEVLLAQSQNCGVFFPDTIRTTPGFNLSGMVRLNAFYVFNKNVIRTSNQYVQNCLTQAQTLPECNTFKTRQLNWTSTVTASCPFRDGICLGPGNSSLKIDTGLIDSRDDLGINSNDKDRKASPGSAPRTGALPLIMVITSKR
jgi:hypothetical protein